MSAALSSTLAHADVIGTANPFWYAISGDSTVVPDSGAGDPTIVAELRSHGLAVVPTVTEDDGVAAFARLLASRRERAAMVRALVGIASAHGYSGVDLDFEDLAVDPGHHPAAADRVAAGYPGLVSQVCAALRAIARSCEITVMPRTSAAHTYWRGYLATWVYDYGALAKATSRVQIMAYDEHAPDVAAGPVAPLPWVRQVIAYARSQMPLDRAELGVPAYGYDWSAGSGTTLTAPQAEQLARSVRAHVRWNAAQAESMFRYRAGGVEHTVWFENATADADRAALAARDGMAGIAIWAAGDEDPALWPRLARLR